MTAVLILQPLHPLSTPLTQAWVWASTPQGLHGHGLSALPADNEVLLVVPSEALSWHRVTLPRTPRRQWRAVLDGLLEERLLAPMDSLHLALAPDAVAGQPCWVAALRRDWLRTCLDALQAAGRRVTRIVPEAHPGARATLSLQAQDGRPQLLLCDAAGVLALPLAHDGPAPNGLPACGWTDQALADAQACTEPACSSLAERLWPELRWTLRSEAERLRQLADSAWDLAQFDFSLAPAARRGQQLRQTLRQWATARAWRPARWGLAALLLIQLLGLNLLAWQTRRDEDRLRQSMQTTAQATFAQLTLVLDAPAQMRRELERLQLARGQAAPDSLEALLQTLAGGRLRQVDYRPGRVQAQGWQGPPPATLQARLPQGWQAALDGATLTLHNAGVTP